jgi:hypothetical protein
LISASVSRGTLPFDLIGLIGNAGGCFRRAANEGPMVIN